ncbi:hypothetical protein LBMAG25_11700 [Bacteroidota bacterium]|nr:hypothetical protein LBMAG25_11700 [Bacteroidota bacterium]
MLYSSVAFYKSKMQNKRFQLEQHLTINTNLTLQYDTISIYSNKQIIVQSGVSRTIIINTSDIPVGIYFVKVFNSDVHNLKLVVIR